MALENDCRSRKVKSVYQNSVIRLVVPNTHQNNSTQAAIRTILVCNAYYWHFLRNKPQTAACPNKATKQDRIPRKSHGHFYNIDFALPN